MRETRSILGLGWAGVASSVFVENTLLLVVFSRIGVVVLGREGSRACC